MQKKKTLKTYQKHYHQPKWTSPSNFWVKNKRYSLYKHPKSSSERLFREILFLLRASAHNIINKSNNSCCNVLKPDRWGVSWWGGLLSKFLFIIFFFECTRTLHYHARIDSTSAFQNVVGKMHVDIIEKQYFSQRTIINAFS